MTMILEVIITTIMTIMVMIMMMMMMQPVKKLTYIEDAGDDHGGGDDYDNDK